MMEQQSVGTLIDACRPVHPALHKDDAIIGDAAGRPQKREEYVTRVQNALAVDVARRSAVRSAGRAILRSGARVNVDSERPTVSATHESLLVRDFWNVTAIVGRKRIIACSVTAGSKSDE